MAQIYKIPMGKACFLKLFTIDNILNFHIVLKLINFRLFFLDILQDPAFSETRPYATK